MLEKLIRQLNAAEDLAEPQIAAAVEQMVLESVPVVTKAEFLSSLARKGETAAEIACFVRELRARAIPAPVDAALRQHEILDVVGTGGDRLSTFNISTTVALLAAAAGVKVAKHGNRASTSTIGSADVIEALGIPFDRSPQESTRALREQGFAFFFAPKYHPAFRHIIPARKLCAERGQPTLFNYLGPLLNPANPSAMLIGVPKPDLCKPLATVLQTLGTRRAMLVCGGVAGEPGGPRYLDELSPLGPTTVAEFYQPNGMNCSQLSPEAFPLQQVMLADLRGGDREVNCRIIREILGGVERGPKRDAVLLNAAAALFVAGRARHLTEGWEIAAEVIDSGLAAAKLKELSR